VNNIFLILAKSNSIGLKNKNLLSINSLTLLEAEMIKARNANVFHKFYLSSDSDEILKIGKKNQFHTIKRSIKLTKNKFSNHKYLYDDLPVIISRQKFLPNKPIWIKKEKFLSIPFNPQIKHI
jgi:CMP-N-acetylneuraminic acid synthetase